MLHKKCLVLNINYQPVCVISWQRAMTLSFIDVPEYKCSIVKYYQDDNVKLTMDRTCPVPAVIMRNRYVSTHRKRVPLTKRNLLIRDVLTCQYCALSFHPRDLTFDHVIPKSLWYKRPDLRINKRTPTHWENIVTACYRCNGKKGSLTPEKAGMKLLNVPKKPNPIKYIPRLTPWEFIANEWVEYLIYIYPEFINEPNH